MGVGDIAVIEVEGTNRGRGRLRNRREYNLIGPNW